MKLHVLLAVAALVGILLNAILPGKDYEFGKNPKGDKAVDFEINPSLRKDKKSE